MTPGESQDAHALYLQIQGTPEGDTFSLSLSDDHGHTADGTCTLDTQRQVREGYTWRLFLSDYLGNGASEDNLAAFGSDLFRWLVLQSGLAQAWGAIQAAAGRRPLHLTLEFGDNTQALAELPLELLRDSQGYLFAQPGSSLVRTLLATEARHFEPLAAPRVLLAWACPAGAGHPFDPQPHREALRHIFGDTVQELQHASLAAMRQRLEQARASGEPFDYLHVVAHGYRDDFLSGMCLHDERGALDYVEGGRLAHALRGQGLRFAFLCSCKTTVTNQGAFSGVAQQLLAPRGGDLPCVVATQANLPIHGSAVLARRFYQHLRDASPPGEALAHARREAYPGGGQAWSAPVLLTRPPPRSRVPTARPADLGAVVPRRPETYLARPVPQQETLQALRTARLVSLVGLPGIGKTELGREVARLARQAGTVDRVFYLAAYPGYTLALLRSQVAVALGLSKIPEEDALLAAALAQEGLRTLLVLDNAEDLMRDEAAQDGLRGQLETLLNGAARLRVLLTTRWELGGDRLVHVPPMTREETDRLLAAELEHLGVLREGWRGSAAWTRLLELMDGHPRSLALLARQFTIQGTTPEEVVRRLERHREGAIVEPGLLGQKRAFEALHGDQRARLKSLVATMEMSYEVVEKQYPQAAEAFTWLSFFPAGLPYEVAREVTGDDETLALKQLLRMHLVEWHDERTFYPVPLHWYAERKRKAAVVDEVAVHQRALVAFAKFTEACDQRFLTGDEVVAATRLLAEERTLLQLTAWVAGRTESGGAEPILARIAISVDNVLMMANRLETAKTLLEEGLRHARACADQSSTASALLRLGRLAMRVADLEGARASYQQALPIFREIRARLGEAYCLQSLGDLQMRVADLEGARASYQQALPIFRELRDRLGEAYCLQGLGLLALANQEVQEAFQLFLEVLRRFQDISDQLGQQAAHGYLARVATAAGTLDQALLLAEVSLHMGRHIHDAFGQTLNLKLQLQIFLQQEEGLAAFATLHLLRDLHAAMRDQAEVAHISQVLGTLPQEALAGFEPEAQRQAAIAAARQRLEQSGRQLYDVPK